MKKVQRLLLLLGITLFITNSTFATGGYFRHGIGVKYSALAGAGTALSLSSIGAATNPAGLAFLGTRYDFNLALFSPKRSFTVTGNPSGYPGTFGLAPGTVESASNYFPMPTFAADWQLNKKITIGAMFYGNGGMNTDYQKQIFGDVQSPGAGVNIEQMFFGITFAYRIAKEQAIGISPLFVFQRFSAKGLGMFGAMGMSDDPNNLTGNRKSTSTGFGFRLGYQGRVLPFLRVGASYQLKINMSKFDEYKGLFAEQGDFDVPTNWNVGVAVDLSKDLTVAIDMQEIYYSKIKSIGNPLNPRALPPAFPDGKGGYTPNPNHIGLGAANGSGFGWTDVAVYKFGVIYNGFKNLSLMGGFSIGDNPIGSSEVLFNILAPAVITTHITFGATYKLNQHNELTLGFMYAPENSVSGANPFEAPNQQTIKIAMHQWQVEIGYGFN